MLVRGKVWWSSHQTFETEWLKYNVWISGAATDPSTALWGHCVGDMVYLSFKTSYMVQNIKKDNCHSVCEKSQQKVNYALYQQHSGN